MWKILIVIEWIWVILVVWSKKSVYNNFIVEMNMFLKEVEYVYFWKVLVDYWLDWKVWCGKDLRVDKYDKCFWIND